MATNNSINTLNTSGGASSSMQLLQLGIGGAPTSLQDLKITGTVTPWAVTDNSTRTSTSSNTQASFFSSPTFFPTSGATTCANMLAQAFFKTPTATTITTCAGFYYTASYTGNVGTLTNTYGIFIDADSGAAGTINNSYGLRVVAPSQATNKYTCYFDAGVGIGAVNSTSATNALLVTGAMGCTTALNACSASGIATIGSTTALTVSAAGLLSAANATDSSSGTTGAINTLGGLGVTKSIFCGGNLLLPTSTSSIGNLKINSVVYLHSGIDPSSFNFFAGPTAGNYTLTGTNNIAIGNVAGKSLTSGIQNVYIGVGSGQYNASGNQNTGVGSYALDGVTGNSNSNNTAIGWGSMTVVTTGSDNTACGINTGANISTGQFNALFGNGTGSNITTGSTNLLFGSGAGSAITTGNTNVIVGDHPGSTTLGTTIIIGYGGSSNAVFNSGCFIDGIQQQSTTGSAVLVNASGKLAPLASAKRFKTNIVDMPHELSGEIYKLIPRCFNYIDEKDALGNFKYEQSLQPGLIAEEVEQTPLKDWLVVYQADGQTQSVHYYKLPVLLLNEMQKQQAIIEKLTARIEGLEAQAITITALQAALITMNSRLEALEGASK